MRSRRSLNLNQVIARSHVLTWNPVKAGNQTSAQMRNNSWNRVKILLKWRYRDKNKNKNGEYFNNYT